MIFIITLFSGFCVSMHLHKLYISFLFHSYYDNFEGGLSHYILGKSI